MIDASIIESAARPNRCIDIAVDRNEETEVGEIVANNISDEAAEIEKESNAEICESVDPDAKWLKEIQYILATT